MIATALTDVGEQFDRQSSDVVLLCDEILLRVLDHLDGDGTVAVNLVREEQLVSPLLDPKPGESVLVVEKADEGAISSVDDKIIPPMSSASVS